MVYHQVGCQHIHQLFPSQFSGVDNRILLAKLLEFFCPQHLTRFCQTLVLGGEAFGNNHLPFLQKGFYRLNVFVLTVKFGVNANLKL